MEARDEGKWGDRQGPTARGLGTLLRGLDFVWNCSDILRLLALSLSYQIQENTPISHFTERMYLCVLLHNNLKL